MPQIITRRIACGRCAERAQFFSSMGFTVLDCQPAPDSPGHCVLRMFDPSMGLTSGTAEAEPAEAGDAAVSGATGGAVAPAAAPVAPAAAPLALPAAAPASSMSGAPLTMLQARTASAIVNLFETSDVLGDYSKVTLLAGDTGHLSFGRSQTTLGSGNLSALVERYVANAGARFGARLAGYLAALRARDIALDHDRVLHNVLRASADDPVMRDTQDVFFDEQYWRPAVKSASRAGLTTPLGVALAYDGHVHGSWGPMRDRTNERFGTPARIGEHDWIAHYIAVRRGWLADHPRQILRATVYRMDTFQGLVDLGAWDLGLPLVVRGREISTMTLSGTPPGCYDGPAPGTRGLMLTTPLLRGLDVRLVQLALSDRGVRLKADGIFGNATRTGLMEFQTAQGQPRTGALDAAQVAALSV